MHTLANEHLRLGISARGTLDELTCLATGTNHVARPGMDLWRIILQDEESLANLATPGGQPCRVERRGDGLEIVVPQLVYPFHGRPRVAAVSLRLAVRLEGDACRWIVTVDNRDPHIRVMEVWAPIVNGLRPPADWALYFPQDCGLRLVDPVRNLGSRGQMLRFGVNNANLRELYPGKASIRQGLSKRRPFWGMANS